jgi:hypothetical protein
MGDSLRRSGIAEPRFKLISVTFLKFYDIDKSIQYRIFTSDIVCDIQNHIVYDIVYDKVYDASASSHHEVSLVIVNL